MEFAEISIAVVVAATGGVVAKLFKQPLIIGYLFAGFLLALFGLIGDYDTLSGLGQVGVALLLFLIGLEINIREIRSIGKVAFVTGMGADYLYLVFWVFACWFTWVWVVAFCIYCSCFDIFIDDYYRQTFV